MSEPIKFSPEEWMGQLYNSERKTVLEHFDNSSDSQEFLTEMPDSFPFISEPEKVLLYNYLEDWYLKWI